MPEKTRAPQPSGVDRRSWIKSAAGLAAGAAAAPLLSGRLDAAEQAVPASTVGATRTVRAPNVGNTVETECGKIRWFSNNGILTFKGIPYGKSDPGSSPRR